MRAGGCSEDFKSRRKIMRYGNCLTGAAILMWKERNNNPRFMLKTRPGTKVPHFMVKSDHGLHHYKVSKDIFPWPLCYLVFQGRFQTVPNGEETDFEKNLSRK
jgi:hypothetical protein